MGPDRFREFSLHDCDTVLVPPLTFFFNLTLRNLSFRNMLKNSRIVPLHKKEKINYSRIFHQ